MSRSKLRGRDVVFLLNKYRERRATMRFNEIVSADDQLALWRLISDNVWSAVLAQAKEQERLKAQAAATPKPKRIKPKKIVPKKPPAPKPKPPAPKPPPPKSPGPQQARVVTPNRPPPLPSSQPVLRPTHSKQLQPGRCLWIAATSDGVKPGQLATINRRKTRKRGVLAPNMAVFKIFGHGDDRHSKNGFCIPTGKVCWLYWVFIKSGILQRVKQALHG